MKKKFNSLIENRIHKKSFEAINKVINTKYPKLKVKFKTLSLKD